MPFRTRAASGTFAAILLTAAVTSQAAGADRGFTNYDGDTFRATFRIENIDTPEIEGKCDAERKLAIRAREFTRTWLAGAGVSIRQTGVDQYGRILARVSRAGDDLGEALIRKGLARPWKGRRESWC